jgi:hypothetical protein
MTSAFAGITAAERSNSKPSSSPTQDEASGISPPRSAYGDSTTKFRRRSWPRSSPPSPIAEALHHWLYRPGHPTCPGIPPAALAMRGRSLPPTLSSRISRSGLRNGTSVVVDGGMLQMATRRARTSRASNGARRGACTVPPAGGRQTDDARMARHIYELAGTCRTRFSNPTWFR